ncbi:MAG: hypothetical protein J6O40_02325 [Ruminococcus sp.]|nr:hypothetical protein [Ruminococcus sp.]
MNKELEKLLSELSPELQQKARECKTQEELSEFFADNDIELPEDILDNVAGGCGSGYQCPSCKKMNLSKLENDKVLFSHKFQCNDCGRVWYC